VISVFKLTAIALALGATFAAQATSVSMWSNNYVSVRDMPLPGTLVADMTSTFGNATEGGTLHTAVYDNSVKSYHTPCCSSANAYWSTANSFDIYYQITNNAESLLSVTDIGQKVFARDLLPPFADGTFAPPQGAWVAQIKNAFGGFSAGTVRAIASSGQSSYGSEDGIYLDNNTTAWFEGSGIAPGATSYTGVVSAGTDVYPSYALATVMIDGFQAAAFVSTIPEPETYAMLLAGLGLIGTMVRRKKSAKLD
jgi:hypothetical protein